MAADNRTKLYNALKSEGYTDIGSSQEEFNGLIENPNNLRLVYDALKTSGYTDIGKDYAEFEGLMNPHYNPIAAQNPQAFAPEGEEIKPEQIVNRYGPRQSTQGMFQYGMAPITMDQAKDITDSYAADKDDKEHVTGLYGAVKQGTDALVQNNKYAAGEIANAYYGGRKDAERAIEKLESGEELKENESPWWRRAARKAAEYIPGVGNVVRAVNTAIDLAPEFNEDERAKKIALEALEEAGGDKEKAKQILEEKAAKDSWGDRMKEEANAALAEHKPTKGAAAWVGNLLPQMAGIAAAMGIGSLNPAAGAVVGYANMAALTGSTMGASMREAREAGATDEQVWAAGLADAVIEMATEQIPFSNYTNRIFGAAKSKITKELLDAIANNPKARKEMQQLLAQASEELGGNLLSKGNVKDYLGDVLAEGGSEFVAGALQTMTPMLYQNPENYPTITEIIRNGGEGLAAGLFMGAILGGASKKIEYDQNRGRRKAQGFVRVAEIHQGEKVSIGEVVGDDGSGKVQVLIDGKVVDIPKANIKKAYDFSFAEFDRAAIDTQKYESYDAGYATTDAQGMASIKKTMEDARAAISFLSDEAVQRLDENPVPTLELMESEGATDEELQAVRDYVNASAAYKGMVQRMNEEADEQTKGEQERLAAISNEEGMVQPVVLDNDTRAYVQKGTLDDEHIVVVDDNGVQSMVAPSTLRGVENPYNAQESIQAMRNEYVNARLAELDNPVEPAQQTTQPVAAQYNYNDEVTILDDNNQPVRATIASNADGDGRMQVETETPVNGKRVNYLTAEEINGRLYEAPGELVTLNDGQNEFRAKVVNDLGNGTIEIQREGENKIDVVPASWQQAQQAEQSAPIKEPIPMEKVGKEERPAYHLVPFERTLEELHGDADLTQQDIDAFITANITELQGEMKKVAEKEPKMGANIAKFKQDKIQWAEKQKALQAKLDYYTELQKRNAELESSELQEAYNAPGSVEGFTTPDEVVAGLLGSIKITPESFKRETGLSTTEQKGLVGIIANEDKGGVSVERAAEIIAENYSDELAASGYTGDVQGIRNMIISVLSDGNPRTYAKRGAEQRANEEAENRRREIETWVAQFDMTVEEYFLYEQTMLPRVMRDYQGFDENEYYSILADEYNNSNYDTERESESVGRGREVLQGEQPVPARGAEPVGAGNEGGAVPSDVQGGTANGANEQAQSVNSFDGEGDLGAANGVAQEEIGQPVGISEQLENGGQNALQNGANELNLQQENEQNNVDETNISRGGQVSQSVPQGEHRTQTLQIGGMEETAARLGERIEADGGTPQSGLSRDVREIENRVTREYAQENGLWIPFNDVFKLGRPSKSGNEHDTYVDTENRVIYKVNNRMNTPSIVDLLNRMALHNKYFPESKYSLVGFTAISNNGDVWPVFAQDYVSGARVATNEEIDAYMSALGFTPMGNGRYTNGEIVAKDLHPRNVLADADGDIYVVDAEFEPAKQESGEKSAVPSVQEQIQAAEAEVNTNPTEAQKEAGNYKKGHVQIGTFNVTIEQPKGSVRSGVDADGKKWEVEMQNTYGYIRGTEGVDGDHIDVFLSDDIDGWDGRKVFVVDQRNADGSFDEHKVMLGFNDINDAEAAYMSNYEEGWQGLGAITGVSIEEFEKWIASSHRKTKAFAEYKSVKTTEGQSASGLAEAPVKAETPTISQDSEQVPERTALTKGVKWEQTGEPEKMKLRTKKHKDSHDVTWYIGGKRYGSTTAERDLLRVLADEYGNLNAVWNAYEQNQIILSSNEAAILKKLIETNTTRAELQQGDLSLERENSAFKEATERTVEQLKKVAPVEIATEEQARAMGVFGFSTTKEEFKARAQAAKEQAGIVAYGLNGQELPITQVEKHSFTGNLKNARQEAKSWAENNFVGKEYDMPEGGGKYIVTKRAIGKYIDKTAVEKSENPGVHLSALVKLPEIISNSVDAEIHPDYNRGEDGVRRRENGIGNEDMLVHRLYGAIEIDGKVYRVKTTMHEFLNGNDANSPHSYEVTQIELIEDSTVAPTNEAHNPLNRSTNSISATKLLNGVEKSYDKGKKLLDESKDAPEMMTVYHGSGAKFDRFDHSFMGTGEGAQAFGWGTYVTEVEGIGKQYAEAGNHAFSSLRAKIGNIDAALHSLDLDVERANRELEQNSNESAKERAKYIIENAKYRREALYEERASVEKEMSKLGRNLYTVEIPEDNGGNYLHWEERINSEIQERVANGLQSIGFELEPEMNHLAYSRDGKIAVINLNAKGKDLYAELSEALGGDKQASLFLRDMGFVGISYPAEATTGGRADKARNYVIFNESDARITDRVEFFRTANGTVYGWAVNGKVYLTPDGINPNTPVHEYTHLWASAVEKSNPKEWAKIVEGLKASPAWNEVLADEGYRDIWNNDNRVASEVLSRLAGRENYRREMERAQREIDNATNPIEAAERITFRESVKQAVQRFWDNVKRLFQKITGKAVDGSWEDFVEMPLRDFWAGVKPEAIGSPLDRMFIGEQGAANDLATAEEGDVLYRTKETAPETVSVQNEHLQTVVSSADGAKILKDLDNAIVEYDNDTKTKEKTFLGNLAKVLGAKKHGSNSQYATFEAVNGKVFTIRLANHNATVSTFDNHDENEGISIVVTAQGNNGITNDGNAHIVEFFYDAIKLRKADGKPLVEILKSIKQALYSGEYRDTTGLAIREEVNSDILSREGYGPLTDSEVATESDVYAKALGRPRYTGRKMREYVAKQRQKMVERANELAEKLHLDNVEVVTEEGKTTAKGFYRKSTGKITVVIPNHSSVADVEQTLLHEAVAHYGLRQLFGESFDTFLDNVYYNASEEIRAEIDRLAMEKYDGETRTATEEYLASLAENTNFENAERSSWWQKIKRFFVDMLAKAGVKLDAPLTDNELRYILWRSYENLAEPGRYRSIIGEAADIAKQYDLGVGNYAPVQASGDMVAERDVLNREGTPATEEFINTTVVASNWGNTHKGAAPCIVIQSAETLRAQLEQAGFGAEDIADAEKIMNNGATGGYNPNADKVVIFKNDLSKKELRLTLWHENAHRAIEKLYTQEEIERVFKAIVGEYEQEVREVLAKIGYEVEDQAEEFLVQAFEHLLYDAKTRVMLEGGKFKVGEGATDESKILAEFIKPIIKFINNGGERGYNPDGGIRESDRENQGGYVGQHQESLEVRNAGNESGDTRTGIKARRGTGVALTFDEAVAKGLMELAAKNSEDYQLRVDALKSFTKLIKEAADDLVAARVIRGVAARQRDYDKATVQKVMSLASLIMNNSLIDNFTRGEVKRLIGAIHRAVGKKELMSQGAEIVSLITDRQIKACDELLTKQLKTKASKINASGVEVQSGLDIKGQRIMGAFKDGKKLDIAKLNQLIAAAREKMGSADNFEAENAALDLQGYMLAQQYLLNIKASEDELASLKMELKSYKEQYDAGKISHEDYKASVALTEEAMLANKLERVGAYLDIMQNFGIKLRASVQAAAEFREREVERARAIQHNANSDMQGISADSVKPDRKRWEKVADFLRYNNPITRGLMLPMATFENLLKKIGEHSVAGRGYLYDRFVPQFERANDTEYRKVRQAMKELDSKLSEIFGKEMKWNDLAALEKSMPGMSVKFWSNGQMIERQLSQGHMLYIYMVNKMVDGRMKLNAMGITEDKVREIISKTNPKFIELADWIQDTFLQNKRREYNAVYERMFGAPMANIEDYFPLVINQRDLPKEIDVAAYNNADTLPSTITGSVIKRVRNNKPLDITNANAFAVVVDHINKMEHWAAFAEFNRDLNVLLSYNRFKNQVLNMKTVRFGSGEELWKTFRDVCAMAAGSYIPEKGMADEILTNLSKGVAYSKVSFGINTAIKQLLSTPAFATNVGLTEVASNIFQAKAAWDWANSTLPGFKERIEQGSAGDNRLNETDADWDWTKMEWVQKVKKAGMLPNIAVDAVVVAIGAKSVYDTKVKRYKADGYSDAIAHEKALADAAIVYNTTQQSGERAYLSKLQQDRTFLATLLSTFRNNSFAYGRIMFNAISNLKNMIFKSGYREESIGFMTKKMVREGLSEENARKAAERIYNRAYWKNIAELALFSYGLQLLWNLGANMWYLLLGDDDEEKKEIIKDAVTKSAFMVDGVAAGDMILDVVEMAKRGRFDSNVFASPFVADLSKIGSDLVGNNKARGVMNLANCVAASMVGVSPQRITDVVVAIIDVCDGDLGTANEVGYLLMRVAQVPESQQDKFYLDEVGMNAAEAKQADIEVLAKRYARYKRMKEIGVVNFALDDFAKSQAEEKYFKRFEKMFRERLHKDVAPEEYSIIKKYEESGEYKEIEAQLKHIKENKSLSPIEYATRMDNILSSPEGKRFLAAKEYKKNANRVYKQRRFEYLGEVMKWFAKILRDTQYE